MGPAGTDTQPWRRSEDPGQIHAEAAAAFRHGCETRRCGRRSPASKGHRGHGKEGRARPATCPTPRRPCPPTLHRTGPRAQARSAPPQPGRCTPPGGLPCPPAVSAVPTPPHPCSGPGRGEGERRASVLLGRCQAQRPMTGRREKGLAVRRAGGHWGLRPGQLASHSQSHSQSHICAQPGSASHPPSGPRVSHVAPCAPGAKADSRLSPQDFDPTELGGHLLHPRNWGTTVTERSVPRSLPSEHSLLWTELCPSKFLPKALHLETGPKQSHRVDMGHGGPGRAE